MLSLNVNIHAMPMPAVERPTRQTQPNAKQTATMLFDALRNALRKDARETSIRG
jgi:hypothetical protein